MKRVLLEGLEPNDLFLVADSILSHENTSSGSHRITAERRSTTVLTAVVSRGLAAP